MYKSAYADQTRTHEKIQSGQKLVRAEGYSEGKDAPNASIHEDGKYGRWSDEMRPASIEGQAVAGWMKHVRWCCRCAAAAAAAHAGEGANE